MHVLYWLVRKDLLRFVADRNGAMLTVFMPVILGVLLGLLFAPRPSSGMVELLVVNEDTTDASNALVEALKAHDALTVEQVDRDTARQRLETGDARVALILQPGVGLALTPIALFSGAQVDAPIWYDPSAETEAKVATGLITQVTMQEVGKALSDPKSLQATFKGLERLLVLDPTSDPKLAEFLQAGLDWSADAEEQSAPAGGGMQPPLALKKEPVVAAGGLSNYNTYAHNFAGMLCMFILFWAIEAAKELVIERDRGVEDRVLLTPIPRFSLLVSRAVSTALVGLLISAAVYTAAIAGFGVEIRGSVAGFIAMLLSIAVSAAGFSVLLAGLGKSERQISNLGTFFVLIASFLGGAWLPSFLMPEWIQNVAMVLPTYWATDGLAAMTWRGLSLSHAMLPCGALLGMGALAAFVGVKAYGSA